MSPIQNSIVVVALTLFSYLIGSLPFGYWWAKKVKGPNFDIRDHGSCSIGFTNVLRVLGWRTAIPVLLLDIAKGAIPVVAAIISTNSEILGVICLMGAMLGHAKSLYFYLEEGVFSGGKSVASAFGGLLVLNPLLASLTLLCFLIIVATTRIVSLGSMLSAGCAFGLTFCLGLENAWKLGLGLVFIMILYTHRRNIARLLMGIEPKLGDRSESDLVVSAFMMHPLDVDDLEQMRLTKPLVAINRVLSRLERLARRNPNYGDKESEILMSETILKRIIALGPMLEAGAIDNIKLPGGKKAKVVLFAIPFLPAQIQSPEYSKSIFCSIRAAIVESVRRAQARVMTLGALISTGDREGGKPFSEFVKKRGLDIQIDNGAAATVAANMIVIKREAPKTISDCVIMVCGAKGLIGGITSQILTKEAKEVIKVSYTKDENGGKVVDLSRAGEADIIVFATSSPTAIITDQNSSLLQNTPLIVDLAVPPNVSVSNDNPIAAKITRGGLAVFADGCDNKVDFHFGSVEVNGEKQFRLPPCLIQGLILAATKRYQYASTDRKSVTIEAIEFFENMFKKFGIEIVGTDLSEATIFSNLQKHS